MNLPRQLLIGAVRFYRYVLSPAKAGIFGPVGRCRFTPSCSEYALEALQTHGVCRGSALALWRLCRCHPWGKFGPDPVPSHFNRNGPSPSSRLRQGEASLIEHRPTLRRGEARPAQNETGWPAANQAGRTGQ